MAKCEEKIKLLLWHRNKLNSLIEFNEKKLLTRCKKKNIVLFV